MVGADANSHKRLWGSSNTNQRGVKLAEFLIWYFFADNRSKFSMLIELLDIQEAKLKI